MKTNKLILPVLTGVLFAAAANAQDVNLVLTGSTAFRSITLDRAKALFDAGYTTTGDAGGTLPVTYYGTMSTAIPSLGSSTVAVKCSFSGSGSGMLAVDGLTPVPTRNPLNGTTNNVAPDLALSDVFPESATPPINAANFDVSRLGVIPFVFIRNNALTGINNITKEQATLLMTASGIQSGLPGMPASFLGGADNNPVYFTGRDAGSGTRISVHKDVGFTGTPVMWNTNNSGGYVQFAGASSAGNSRNVIASGSRIIGYLGEADALAIAASATQLSYNGVAFSHANVASGKYPIWGYEIICNRAGQLSANQQAVRDALIGKITDATFQQTSALYTNSFVSLADMQVERGTDGGTITSLTF